jgi:hypothetical protein
MDMKNERAEPIGHTDIRVIEAAYALAKTKNEENAREILRGVPHEIYPALRKHMKEHANLFTVAIHAMVVSAADEPKLTKAEALFSH